MLRFTEFDLKTGQILHERDPNTRIIQPRQKEIEYSYLEHWLQKHHIAAPELFVAKFYAGVTDSDRLRLEAMRRVLVYSSGENGYFADPQTATLLTQGNEALGIQSIYATDRASPHNLVAYGSLVSSDGIAATALSTVRILVIDDEARTHGVRAIQDRSGRILSPVELSQLYDKMGDGTMLITPQVMTALITEEEREQITRTVFTKAGISSDISTLTQEGEKLESAIEEVDRQIQAFSNRTVTQFRAATIDLPGMIKGTMATSQWCERLGVAAIISKNDIKGDDGRLSEPGIKTLSDFWLNRKSDGRYGEQAVGPQIKGCIPEATLHEFNPRTQQQALKLAEIASDPRALLQHYVEQKEKHRLLAEAEDEAPRSSGIDRQDWLYEVAKADHYGMLTGFSKVNHQLARFLKGEWYENAIQGVRVPSAMAQHHSQLQPWECCNRDLPHGTIVAYYRSPFPNVGAAAIAINNTEIIKQTDPEAYRKDGVAYLPPWTAKNVAITDFDRDANGYFCGYTATVNNLPEQIRIQLEAIKAQPPDQQYEAGRALFAQLIEQYGSGQESRIKPAEYPVAVQEFIERTAPDRKPPEIVKQKKIKHPWPEDEAHSAALWRAWSITADNPTGKVANIGMTLQSFALETQYIHSSKREPLLRQIANHYQTQLRKEAEQKISIPSEDLLEAAGFANFRLRERMVEVAESNQQLANIRDPGPRQEFVQQKLGVVYHLLSDLVNGPMAMNLQTAVDTAKSSRGIDENLHKFAKAIAHKKHLLRETQKDGNLYTQGKTIQTNTQEPIGWNTEAINRIYQDIKLPEILNKSFTNLFPTLYTPADYQAAMAIAVNYKSAMDQAFAVETRVNQNRREDKQPTLSVTTPNGNQFVVGRLIDGEYNKDDRLWQADGKQENWTIRLQINETDWKNPETVKAMLEIQGESNSSRLLGYLSSEQVIQHHLHERLQQAGGSISISAPMVELRPPYAIQNDKDELMARAVEQRKAAVAAIPPADRMAYACALGHLSVGMDLILKDFLPELTERLQVVPPIRLRGLQHSTNEAGQLPDGEYTVRFSEYRYQKDQEERTVASVAVVIDGVEKQFGSIADHSIRLPIDTWVRADIQTEGNAADLQVKEVLESPPDLLFDKTTEPAVVSAEFRERTFAALALVPPEGVLIARDLQVRLVSHNPSYSNLLVDDTPPNLLPFGTVLTNDLSLPAHHFLVQIDQNSVFLSPCDLVELCRQLPSTVQTLSFKDNELPVVLLQSCSALVEADKLAIVELPDAGVLLNDATRELFLILNNSQRIDQLYFNADIQSLQLNGWKYDLGTENEDGLVDSAVHCHVYKNGESWNTFCSALPPSVQTISFEDNQFPQHIDNQLKQIAKSATGEALKPVSESNAATVPSALQALTIVTDGACKGNPGPGGWGAILIQNSQSIEIGGRGLETTNNRMEMTAGIEALKYARAQRMITAETPITLISDSQYFINGATGDWKRKANLDLWNDYDRAAAGLQIQFEWVRGHNGHALNERVDAIAQAFAVGQQPALAGSDPDQAEPDDSTLPAQAVFLDTDASRCLLRFYNNEWCVSYQPQDQQILSMMQQAQTEGLAYRCDLIEQANVSQTVLVIDFPNEASLRDFEQRTRPLPIQFRYEGEWCGGFQFVESPSRLAPDSVIKLVPDDTLLRQLQADPSFVVENAAVSHRLNRIESIHFTTQDHSYAVFADLMILDVDGPHPKQAVERLQADCATRPEACWAIYQTQKGIHAMRLDTPVRPREADPWYEATAADSRYLRLCQEENRWTARITAKLDRSDDFIRFEQIVGQGQPHPRLWQDCLAYQQALITNGLDRADALQNLIQAAASRVQIAPESKTPDTVQNPGSQQLLQSIERYPCYLSVVQGEYRVHPTWDDCKAETHGVSGALFKKVSSREQAVEQLHHWQQAWRQNDSADRQPASNDRAQIVYLEQISRSLVQSQPDDLFLFGDNLQGKGFGGQAAAMRGEPNAIGIPTKHSPSSLPAAFFSNADLPIVQPIIDSRIQQIQAGLAAGKTLYVPAAGLGTGLADLPQKAPQIYSYLQSRLKSIGIDPPAAAIATPASASSTSPFRHARHAPPEQAYEVSTAGDKRRTAASGKILTDRYANSPISQARALAELLNETTGAAAQRIEAIQPSAVYEVVMKPLAEIAALRPYYQDDPIAIEQVYDRLCEILHNRTRPEVNPEHAVWKFNQLLKQVDFRTFDDQLLQLQPQQFADFCRFSAAPQMDRPHAANLSDPKPHNPIATISPINERVAQHQVKDRAMGEIATQFIGFPATPAQVPSSTRAYLEAWDKIGRANTGQYSSNDVVMVSGSGPWKRTGDPRSVAQIESDLKQTFNQQTVPLLNRAIAAKAEILVGNAAGTDQKVQQYLQERGYQTVSENGFHRMTPDRSRSASIEIHPVGKPVQMVYPLRLHGEVNVLPVDTCFEAMRGYGRCHTTRTFEPYSAYGFQQGDIAIAYSGKEQIAVCIGEQYRITPEMMADSHYQQKWAEMEKHSSMELQTFRDKPTVWGLHMEPLGDFVQGRIIPFPPALSLNQEQSALSDSGFYDAEALTPAHSPPEFLNQANPVSTADTGEKPSLHYCSRGELLELLTVAQAIGSQEQQEMIKNLGLALREKYNQEQGTAGITPPFDYRHSSIAIDKQVYLKMYESVMHLRESFAQIQNDRNSQAHELA